MDKFYNIKDKIENYESTLDLDKTWEELTLKQENLILKKNLKTQNIYLVAISGSVILLVLLWALSNFYLSKGITNNDQILDDTALITENVEQKKKEKIGQQLNNHTQNLDTQLDKASGLESNIIKEKANIIQQQQQQQQQIEKLNSKIVNNTTTKLVEDDFDKQPTVNKKPQKIIKKENANEKNVAPYIGSTKPKTGTFKKQVVRKKKVENSIDQKVNESVDKLKTNSSTKILVEPTTNNIESISAATEKKHLNKIIKNPTISEAEIEDFVKQTKVKTSTQVAVKKPLKNKYNTYNKIDQLPIISKKIGLKNDRPQLLNNSFKTCLIKEKYKKNFAMFELLGQSGYFSFNYGRVLLNKSFGQTFLQAGVSINPHNISPTSDVIVPLFVAISINQTFNLNKQHAIIIGAGINYNVDIQKNYINELEPAVITRLGYQYQRLKSDWFYKIEILPLVEYGNIIQQYINSNYEKRFGVWGGVGVGRRF